MSLPDALERAAEALPNYADDIRPANGDPILLLDFLSEPAAAEVFKWLLSEEAADAEDLVTAWAEDERGLPLITSVAESSVPKAGRKVLRRAKHKLRSSGVEVTSEAAEEPVVARLPDLDDELHQAFVSNVDPRGSRLVYLVESRSSGGARLFEILLDEVRGVCDFEVYSAGRSKVRRFLKELRTRPQLSVVEVSPAEARALVTRIAAWQPEDRTFPKGFGDWQGRFASAAAGAGTPGDNAQEALGSESTPERLARVVELVQEGQLGPWPPEREVLMSLMERLKERTESELLVTPAQRSEQADAVVDEGVSEVFAGDFAERTASRLRESAFVFWKSDREEEASACLAAAARFVDGGPDDNPVARALLQAALEPAIRSLEPAPEAPAESDSDEEAPLLVES